MATPNVYTRRWFSTFLGRIDPAIVEREVAFLRRVIPVATSRILDLCCGPGRHAVPLAQYAYRVVGLDRDSAALRDAGAHAPTAAFVRADMLRIPLATASVDAVICMWQSFGHFDAAGNEASLAEMARVLRPGGCVILDLYHREYHSAHEGERLIERDGSRIHEQRSMRGDRLSVRLRYESGGLTEEFDWLLYTPTDLSTLAASLGLSVRLACADFDEHLPASEEKPRMQLVFRRS
jgi:SAM-dependent methyltransferase